jgi:hypothetical protein
MNDLEELRQEFEQKEDEYNTQGIVIEKIKEIIEEEDIHPEKIVLYLEGLIQDNTKLLDENKSLNERLEELVSS